MPLPYIAVVGTVAMLLAGGSSVVLGLKPKIGTGLIGAFLAGVSPGIHHYWAIEDAGAAMNEFAHFAKNLGLLGATIALAGVPEPWPASLSQVVPEEQRTDREHRAARHAA